MPDTHDTSKVGRSGTAVFPPPAIDIRSVHLSYGSLQVLKGVSLQVDKGEVVCLIGPSGSGKTSLLRCINHLNKPDAGIVYIDNKPVGVEIRNGVYKEASVRATAAARQDVGMVFQHFNLFNHMSILRNLMIGPMDVLGISKREARDNALYYLDRVGLSDKTMARPKQLSGGQQQRVAIARALCMRPSVMLFDEPTSALDPELVGEVLKVIRLVVEQGLTSVIVTHEIGFAKQIADTIVFMSDGRIVETGPPKQVLEQPRLQRTKEFISAILA